MTNPPDVVRVTRRFTAPPERIFDAWLDGENLARWMRAPRDELVRVVLEARVGGAFVLVVRRNGEEIEHMGEYLEIDRPHRLAFSWSVPRYSPAKTRVDLELSPIDSGTELTLTHEGVAAEYLSRTEAGWRGILDSSVRALT